MVDFEDRLAAMLAELRSTEQITVKEVSEGPLATWLTGPAHALEVIRKAAGLRLPQLMAGNFHRFHELHCYWRGTGADRAIGGEFWLTNLVNVCVDGVPPELPDAQWPARERGRERLETSCEVYGPDGEERSVSAFDAQGLAGIGAVAGFAENDDGSVTIDATTGNPEIWYSVNTDGSLVRLDLTYPEYLEALLLTRGLLCWQYLYADPHDPGFGHARPDLRREFDFLERTFPHDDFSELRARLDAHTRVHVERP